jgi:hypothetical protein
VNLWKCKLNFMILQTNLAIGSTNYIGILNQVHFIDNQFNSNFQPISLHVVNNFMNYITVFHKERYVVYENLLIAPHN